MEALLLFVRRQRKTPRKSPFQPVNLPAMRARLGGRLGLSLAAGAAEELCQLGDLDRVESADSLGNFAAQAGVQARTGEALEFRECGSPIQWARAGKAEIVRGVGRQLRAVAHHDFDPARHLVWIARAQVVALAHEDPLQEILHVTAPDSLLDELLGPDVSIEQRHGT